MDIAFNPVTTTGVYQLWFEPFGQFDFVGPGSCGQKATHRSGTNQFSSREILHGAISSDP